MATSHGCGEIDDGYCFSISPTRELEHRIERWNSEKLTNRGIYHNAANKDRNYVCSQG